MLRRLLIAAAVACLAITAPASAAPIDVPLRESDRGEPLPGPPLDFLRATVEVPRSSRVAEQDGELTIVARLPCRAEISLGAITLRTLPQGMTGRGSARLAGSGRVDAAVTARDGRQLTAPSRWAVVVVRERGVRITSANAELKLPDAVAAEFPQRRVIVYAFAFARPACQRRAGRALVRLTGDLVRSLALRETAEYVPPPPPAPPPTQDLLRSPTLMLRGARRDDLAGQHVANVGDVDGDGRADLAVGAMLADPKGRVEAGSVYVVRSPAAPGTIDLLRPPPSVVRLDGPSRGAWVHRAAGTGDLDGDGIDDLLVGAPRADPSRRRRNAGRAFIVRGARDLRSLDLARPGAAATVIEGAFAGQDTGEDVAGLGDVNGDAIPDVAVSAPDNLGDGEERASVHVVFGRRPLPPRIDLRGLGAGGLTVTGFGDGAEALRIARVGDVNADGLADLAIGWPYANLGADDMEDPRGALVVVFGRRDGGTVDVRNLGAAGLRLDGGRCDGVESVAGPGDVNGDGHADILAGATRQCDNSAHRDSGAYVVFGGPALASGTLDTLGDRGLRIDGIENGAGLSVAAAGDDNGDGLADLLIGEFRAIYLVHGRREAGRIRLRSLGNAGRRVRGRGNFGQSVAALPDADGDGRAEIVSEYDAPGRAHNGGAAVVFSR